MIDPLPAASPGRSPSERQLAVSVVVPVHNGAAALPELVARLRAVLAARGPDAEIVLVNDGSRDASWQAIAELAAGARRGCAASTSGATTASTMRCSAASGRRPAPSW